MRYFCRDCDGGGYCEHDHLRYTCRDCNGKAFCEHDRVKYNCKECGGSGVCEHGSLKVRCTKNAKTCGLTLSSRSIEEIYQASVVYTCLAIQNNASPDLSELIIAVQEKYVCSHDSKTINVDAVFGSMIFEYDGHYWHHDKVDEDRSKTMRMLKDGYSVIRVRDRLDSLSILESGYTEININSRLGHQEVGKATCREAFADICCDYISVWRTAEQLATGLLLHLYDSKQTLMPQHFSRTDMHPRTKRVDKELQRITANCSEAR
jgi:hypothetical protein